ncbi:MAG: hypothetical protein SWX82_17050 [Cyanobacteriota bacterium]|nr:hypothetical protein [Cyanobacteriota bacterium]
MVTGRIIWFGGFNKKLQKINDYGFITLKEGDINRDRDEDRGVYVNRHEIPEDLQTLLEGEKGKGVYVCFDLEENFKGSEAINVELKTYTGVVINFLDQTGEIATKSDGFFHFTSSKSFSSGDYVCCGLCHTSEFDKKEAINVEKIPRDSEYQEIFNICVNSNDSEIATPFFLEYINALPPAEAIPKIREKLLYFNTEGKKLLTSKIIQEYENFLVASSELRNDLDIDSKNELTKYSDFINKHLKNPNTNEYLKKQLLDEVQEKIPRDTQEQRSIYWEKFADLLEYQGFLWNIAPREYKKTVIQNLYKEFFQIVSNFNNSDYPYAQYLQVDWEKLYQEVRENEDDRQLIKEWESAISTNEFKYAQMVSARGAEKLVIKFSRAFGYQVEDISIHQITKQSSDWKLGDIRLDKKTLLDVKNSRFTVNSKVYSEFCVPHKHKRTNQDEEKKEVYIVGVLSPYLQKQFIDGEALPKFSVEKPKILGIFYKRLLSELKTIVGEKDRLKIDLSRLENFYSDLSRAENYNSYLPHWLFDYGDIFYQRQIEIVNHFKDFKAKLPDGKIPSLEDIFIVGINPLPLFVIARENLPTEWESHLPKWKLQFIKSLINIPPSPKKKIISLSHLYISILKHFLQMLEENNSEYSPQEYFNILYQYSQTNHPLKIYDPLQTIQSFCNTLQTLWENREKIELTEFRIFKFRHEGILQGKKTSNDSWKTIIAYCGGNIEGKGKCGCSPLIVGREQNCPTCGYLICPQPDCQYCQKNCSSYKKREAQIKKRRLKRS